MQSPKWSLPAVLLIAVLLMITAPGAASLTLNPARLTSSNPLTGASTSGVHFPSGSPATASVSASGAASSGAAPAPLDWNNSPDCQARLHHYQTYFDSFVPTDVVHTEQSPCYIGHDEPGLNFVSNESYSGSRVQFVIDLPAAGTYTGSAFSTMWLGMWLAGVPCSYRGESYLEVQLNPPFNSLGLTPNPNWTVQAPVWDLVPAGSCDPQCQNDTAFSTIGGVAYCEDDAAIAGVGTYTASGWGNFAPGDRLVVQMVGEVNGTNGLSVFINDTTNASNDLSWTYSPLVTTDHRALTPFFNASTPASGGWGYGLNVEATWENCPEPVGADYPTPCNSYNGPGVSAVGVPTFVSATYWNASTLSYSNPFPWTATTSSAGGCSGYAAPCQDFTTYGGTGSYPYWSLHAWDGNAWWTYGDSYPNQVTDWGGAASQFNPLGFVPVYLDPTTVFNVSHVTIGNTVGVNAAVADPNGVARVQFSSYFCSGSSTPSVTTTDGVLTVSSVDTAQDGNWTATFPTGIYTGTFYYWVRAESTTGVWSTPVAGNVSVAGTTTCTTPPPLAPSFTLANVTAVGGGYALNWTEASDGVVDYLVAFNVSGNATTTVWDAGNHTSLFADLGLDNTSFSIVVTAVNAAGLTASSAMVAAGPTRTSLVATLTGPTSTVFWVHHALVPFAASATGGSAPYTFVFTFGDGIDETVVSSNATVNVTHDYGSYFGDARASVYVTDGLGDTSDSPRQLIAIWATPLGPVASIAAGDGLVNVTWLPPASPGAPVTGYTVYYTENPNWAFALTSTWPYNYTPYGLNLWNTTNPYLVLTLPDNVTVWAQVVAWNVYGEGLLEGGDSFLVATTAPLLAGGIESSSGGGPVPVTVSFSTFVTNGTNDLITIASYSSGFGEVANASTWVTVGGVWVNGSLTFTTPGAQFIVFHVADEFSDVAIATTRLFVSGGVGPYVTLTPPTANGWFGWAGTTLSVSASSIGGIGPFGYAWSFGDGNSATGANVTHAYALSGNYTLSVAVTDETTLGTTVKTQSILIYALPTIAIASAPGPDGALSWSFSAVTTGGSGIPHVTWSFGDGAVANGPTVVHDYAVTGTYTVNASSQDPAGKTAAATYSLTVAGQQTVPTAPVTFLGTDASLWGPVAILLGVLAVVFLVALIYSRFRGGGPPETTAIAPVAPVVSAPPPEERTP